MDCECVNPRIHVWLTNSYLTLKMEAVYFFGNLLLTYKITTQKINIKIFTTVRPQIVLAFLFVAIFSNYLRYYPFHLGCKSRVFMMLCVGFCSNKINNISAVSLHLLKTLLWVRGRVGGVMREGEVWKGSFIYPLWQGNKPEACCDS